ncbi:MAG: 5'-methylthioadenosine/adenosylhomocysteine nucleosidase [Clostridiales bacterium]|nr:5'-methylthioadenosine/adenosylhomocysteine nucleosidase [Clostridiales bacterium]
MTIGILGAMQIEVDLLLSKLENTRKEHISGYDYFSGLLCGQNVIIAKCGVGKVNAAVCCQTMILTYKPDLVINTGVAGGLSKKLDIGDIAVAKDLVQHDMDTTAVGDPIGFVSTVNRLDFPCAQWAVDGIMEAVKAQPELKGEIVRIATGDQFISQREDKVRIIELFDADVCEMEGCAIAQVCLINETDCAVIRSISDSMDGEHHIEFAKFVGIAAQNSANVLMRFLEGIK